MVFSATQFPKTCTGIHVLTSKGIGLPLLIINPTCIIHSTLDICERGDSGCSDTHQKGEEEEELCPYPPPGLGTTTHT